MRATSFTLSELTKQQLATGKRWLEFLDLPSLSMGVYHVAAGTSDRETHSPHDRDEIYVGVDGKGRLTAGGKEFVVEAGTILYVQAGVEHHFHGVTDDLTLLVFFSSIRTAENVPTDSNSEE